jgi:hypothetical protein
VKTPPINVWAKSAMSELAIDRVSKQVADVNESCERLKRLAARLKAEAVGGSRNAEVQLAALNEELYTELAEHLSEEAERQ